MTQTFDIVILGLSITSSWGNGHATTWRSLVRGLASLGYSILFLERDVPWYASNRDDAQPSGAITVLYQSFEELLSRFDGAVSSASLVIVGSYVPDGIRIGRWVTSVAKGSTAFYDIDTPVTLASLRAGSAEYISPELIREYDAYFSFSGGPVLQTLEKTYGSPMARALFCSVDDELYRPQALPVSWDLGYLGTYSSDRQSYLETLLIEPAFKSPENRYVVAGPQYPADIGWPQNIELITHLPPACHPGFYCSQRFTLNITREAMRQAGYSPSVRLFEAAACGVPVISDWWDGLDTIFAIGSELLVAQNADDVLRYLHDTPESVRGGISSAARRRVLQEHTSAARAAQLESYWREMNDHVSPSPARRHRRARQVFGGLGARMEPEQFGTGSSQTLGENVVEATHPGGLHEPS